MQIRLLRKEDIDNLRRPIGFSLITKDKEIMVARVRRIIPWKICKDGIVTLFIRVKDLVRVTNENKFLPDHESFRTMTLDEISSFANAGRYTPRYRLLFETPLLFEEREKNGRRLIRFMSLKEIVTLAETSTPT